MDFKPNHSLHFSNTALTWNIQYLLSRQQTFTYMLLEPLIGLDNNSLESCVISNAPWIIVCSFDFLGVQTPTSEQKKGGGKRPQWTPIFRFEHLLMPNVKGNAFFSFSTEVKYQAISYGYCRISQLASTFTLSTIKSSRNTKKI